MNTTSVTLTNVRLSYVHLMKPHAMDAQQAPKFSCTILLPKTDVQGKARIDVLLKQQSKLG